MDKQRSLLSKTLVIGIILLLIGISINPSTGYGVNNKSIKLILNGNTLYVGGSGLGNFTKIQGAIDNASDGDTVFVYDDSSPYYENVKIEITINLIGENKHTTIIDGNKSGTVVDIHAESVTVRGFMIRNSGNKSDGIYNGGPYCLIEDNIITQNYNGYNQYGASKCVIRDNKFINNTYRAIWVGEDYYISSFEGNSILGAVYGIWFGFVHDANIFNNTISACSEAGIWINWGNGIEIIGNVINNNKYGILSSGWQGLIISSNLISVNKYGIHLEGTMFSKVIKNNFIGNERSASFIFPFFNRWSRNYWDRPRLLPKPIFGTIGIPPSTKEIPWINIDWRPAKEPYVI